jgi:hypothetical protein
MIALAACKGGRWRRPDRKCRREMQPRRRGDFARAQERQQEPRMCSRSVVVFALRLQPVRDAITGSLAALDVERVCPQADLLGGQNTVGLAVPQRSIL